MSIPVWAAKRSAAAVTPTGPDSVADLYIWLDAADLSTLSTSSTAMVAPTATGQTILRWVDKVGSRVWTRGSGTPLFQASANGRSSVQLWGRATNNADSVTSPSLPHPPDPASLPAGTSQGWTLFTVLKRTANAQQISYALNTLAGTAAVRFLQVEPTYQQIVYPSSSTAVATVTGSGSQRAILTNAFDVCITSCNYTTKVLTILTGISTVTPKSATAATIYKWVNSAAYSVGGRYNTLGADVAEVLFYGRTLTAAETSTIKAYLQAKWGL